MLVKISGFTNPDNLQELIKYAAKTGQALPSVIAFELTPGAAREVTGEIAKQLIEIAKSAKIKACGIFTNQKSGEINKISEKLGLDMVQLNGNETSAEVKKLNLPVIKTFYADFHTTFEQLETQIREFKPVIKYILINRPADLETDKPVKSELINQLAGKYKKKVIWSGKLTPENLPDFLKQVSEPLAGIDVTASIESAPGVKNPRKVLQIVSQAQKES